MNEIPNGWVEVNKWGDAEAFWVRGTDRVVEFQRQSGDYVYSDTDRVVRIQPQDLEALGIQKVRRARTVEKIVPITKDLDLRTVKAVLNEGTRYEVTTPYKDEVGLRSSGGERSFYGLSRTTLMFFGMLAVIGVTE